MTLWLVKRESGIEDFLVNFEYILTRLTFPNLSWHRVLFIKVEPRLSSRLKTVLGSTVRGLCKNTNATPTSFIFPPTTCPTFVSFNCGLERKKRSREENKEEKKNNPPQLLFRVFFGHFYTGNNRISSAP